MQFLLFLPQHFAFNDNDLSL